MIDATVRRSMSAEWIKMRSVPATWWTLGLCFLVSVGIALLFGLVVRQAYADRPPGATFDPVTSGFNGLRLSMIALVVFGVLASGGEYAAGTIRPALAAVPARGKFYLAKLATGFLVALAASTVVAVTTFVTAQAAIGPAHNASISDPHVPRAVAGAVIYLTLPCVLAMGMATALRGAAATLGVLVPLFLIVSDILNNVPGVRTVAQFLPDAAGHLLLRTSTAPAGTVLGPWSGAAVLLLWTAAAGLAGYAALRRQDV